MKKKIEMPHKRNIINNLLKLIRNQTNLHGWNLMIAYRNGLREPRWWNCSRSLVKHTTRLFEYTFFVVWLKRLWKAVSSPVISTQYCPDNTNCCHGKCLPRQPRCKEYRPYDSYVGSVQIKHVSIALFIHKINRRRQVS